MRVQSWAAWLDVLMLSLSTHYTEDILGEQLLSPTPLRLWPPLHKLWLGSQIYLTLCSAKKKGALASLVSYHNINRGWRLKQ